MQGAATRLLHTPWELYWPTANQRWALVGSWTEGFADYLSYLVALDGSATFAFPNQFLANEFTLMAPNYLYHARDGKFYTIGPTLTPTALPEPLYPVDPSLDLWVNQPWWEYHVVGQK